METLELIQSSSLIETKCDMLNKVLEQIAMLVENENNQGSNIKLHIIKFNITAYTYTMNKLSNYYKSNSSQNNISIATICRLFKRCK